MKYLGNLLWVLALSLALKSYATPRDEELKKPLDSEHAPFDDARLLNSPGGGGMAGGGSGRGSFGGSGRGFGGGAPGFSPGRGGPGPGYYGAGFAPPSGEDGDIDREMDKWRKVEHPNTFGIPPRRWWNPSTWYRYISPRPEDRPPEGSQAPSGSQTPAAPPTEPGGQEGASGGGAPG